MSNRAKATSNRLKEFRSSFLVKMKMKSRFPKVHKVFPYTIIDMLFVKSSKLTHKAKKYEQSLHHTSHPKVDKFHPIFTVFSVNGTIQSRVFGHIWVLHVEPSSDSLRLRSTRRRRHGGKGRCLRRANEGSLFRQKSLETLTEKEKKFYKPM